jgi:hypothetical protein
MKQIVNDKIAYLINDCRKIIKREISQPHSTLYYFDCGCIIHGEFNLKTVSKNQTKHLHESCYRQWIVGCGNHKYLEESNLSFKALYNFMTHASMKKSK